MNPEEQIPMPSESLSEIDADETSSVDDFIRELEAKEKDLHITSDLRIEVADSDVDGDPPAFVREDLSSQPINSNVVPPMNNKTRHFELENENAVLKVRVMELKNERREIQEKSDRRLKDFENFKYRADRERRGAFIDQIGNLASQMLPVLDNLNRALDAADEFAGERSPEFQQFFDGIVLVNQQLNDVFAGMGVNPITTTGERFDPNFHEAVAVDEDSDLPPNMISGEMLRGYRIGNKVIRHSMVRVTTGPGSPAEAPAAPEAPLSTPADEPHDVTADQTQGD